MQQKLRDLITLKRRHCLWLSKAMATITVDPGNISIATLLNAHGPWPKPPPTLGWSRWWSFVQQLIKDVALEFGVATNFTRCAGELSDRQQTLIRSRIWEHPELRPHWKGHLEAATISCLTRKVVEKKSQFKRASATTQPPRKRKRVEQSDDEVNDPVDDESLEKAGPEAQTSIETVNGDKGDGVQVDGEAIFDSPSTTTEEMNEQPTVQSPDTDEVQVDVCVDPQPANPSVDAGTQTATTPPADSSTHEPNVIKESTDSQDDVLLEVLIVAENGSTGYSFGVYLTTTSLWTPAIISSKVREAVCKPETRGDETPLVMVASMRTTHAEPEITALRSPADCHLVQRKASRAGREPEEPVKLWVAADLTVPLYQLAALVRKNLAPPQNTSVSHTNIPFPQVYPSPAAPSDIGFRTRQDQYQGSYPLTQFPAAASEDAQPRNIGGTLYHRPPLRTALHGPQYITTQSSAVPGGPGRLPSFRPLPPLAPPPEYIHEPMYPRGLRPERNRFGGEMQ